MAAKEDENSVSYSLDHFTELKEVTSLIESIGTICHDNILLEAAEERLIRKCSMFSNLLVLFHLLVVSMLLIKSSGFHPKFPFIMPTTVYKNG